MTKVNVKLGDKVTDPVTDYTGIATTRCSYLQGCDRIGIQAKIDKNGKKPEWEYFDEPQLIVLKRNVIKQGNTRTGGYKPDAAERP